MGKIKEYLTIQNVLYLFIVVCPILDIVSFLFRNKFDTTISVSTFIRPIIPIILFLYIFVKENKKNKIKIIGICSLYALYSVIHLLLYKQILTGCSYSGIAHEAQYLINYSFVILMLYTFTKILYKKNYNNLKYIVFVTMSIYICSIFIAIITKTSSSTYIEGLGYKGWFESANSISSILVMLLAISLSQISNIKSNKIKIGIIALLVLAVVYLTLLIGTRVGLYGSILVLGVYVIFNLLYNVIKLKKLNIKYVLIFLIIGITIIGGVVIFGSNTLQRRQHLKVIESNVIDESTNEVSHVTGDITKLRNKIINNEINDTYMSSAQKQSILDLYNYANKVELTNNDTRMQQLIYNIFLVKNQSNLLLILFGNGYLANTNELVFEMEVPSILFNFGVIGFINYMLPFIIIAVYSIINIIKNIKKIDIEVFMLLVTQGLAFAFSTLAGYTFFNISSATIIVISSVLLINKVYKIRGEKN